MNRLQRALLTLAGIDGKTIAFLRESWASDQPTYAAPSFSANVKHGYHKNEVIFACIVTTADTASQIALQVMGQDGLPNSDHPLARLLAQPNPFMTEFDLWASVISYQYLAGRAVFEIESDRAGRPVALWPLRPDWVRIVPGQDRPVLAYQFGPPGAEGVTLKPEDVLDFPVFDPYNLYRGQAPVTTALRIGQVDNSATDFIKLLFEKGGVPPGYLKTKAKIFDKNEAARIRAEWTEIFGGFRNWTTVGLLDSDADWQKAGFSFAEMGFEVLDARNESRLCMTLRVPPVIVHARLGLAAATDNNYEIEEKAWWRNRLIPLYKSLNDVTLKLARRFSPDLQLRWDTSQVYALQEDIQRRWQRATEALKAGGITINMFMAEVGKPPLGPTGDVFLRPLTVIETPAKISAGKAHDHDHEGKAQHPPDREGRTEAERALVRDLSAYFSDQRARLVAANEPRLGG